MTHYKLDNNTFLELRDFVYKYTGIYIQDNKKYLLENRLQKRLRENKLDSFKDYLYLLKYNQSQAELNYLFDAVTTNETYFFREDKQLTLLINKLIPEIISKQGKVRIWSAACSTGEEPYSIAILIKESGSINASKVEIIASDISNSALNSARRGIYSSYSIRKVPPHILKKYFIESNDFYKISDNIKSMVRLHQINLIDERQMKLVRYVDIVFLRNVLIYFNEEAKKKVINTLYDLMHDTGYLFVGISETLHNVTTLFKPLMLDQTVVYKKVTS